MADSVIEPARAAHFVEQPDAELLAARRRASALYDLSGLISAVNEIGPIVELLLTRARQVFGADRAAVFLRRPDGTFHCVNTMGLSESSREAVNRLYAAPGGVLSYEDGRTIYVADAPNPAGSESLQELALRENFRSVVIAPFNYQGRSIGALALFFDTIQPFGDDDITALDTFANHVAVALNNARLLEAAERQVRRSEFLAAAGRLLNSTLDLHQVLRSLTQATTEVLGEACAIYLLRRNDDELSLVAYADQHTAESGGRLAFLETHLPRLGVPEIGLAAMRGEERLVDRAGRAVSRAPDPYLTDFGACSYLVVPLLAQDRLLGALVVWLFNAALQFAPDDLILARGLADWAAVALENARLYERERRAQQAKDAFLSAVSHELRTPLTAIMGYLQIIRRGLADDSSKLSQQIGVMWRQAQRLQRLVETILDISNLEEGALQLNLERLDLWVVVRAALERLQSDTRPGLMFQVEAATPQCWVVGDRVRLERIFSHLLGNAIKYSPPNGTVRIVMTPEEDRAVVQVIDQGPGLTAAQMGELFQRYYQSDIPLNRSGGLGQSLFASRAIVAAHGGTINAESTPGAGATFRVALPMAAD